MFCASGIGGTGFAAAQDTASNAAFRRLDANRDGYVSRAEASRMSAIVDAFEEADANGDGRLDENEFAKALAISQRKRIAEYLDDTLITAKVRAGLGGDSELRGSNISAQTQRGFVQLSGVVEDERQSRKAVEIAASVRGVHWVRNGLTVKTRR